MIFDTNNFHWYITINGHQIKAQHSKDAHRALARKDKPLQRLSAKEYRELIPHTQDAQWNCHLQSRDREHFSLFDNLQWTNEFLANWDPKNATSLWNVQLPTLE